MTQTKAMPKKSEFPRDINLDARELQDADFRYLFESTQDGMLVIDADSRKIAEANPFFCQLFGMSRSELIGKKLDVIPSLKWLFSVEAFSLDLHKSGFFRRDHLTLKSADGRKIPVEAICNAYHSNGREMIQCNLRDITQREIEEDEVRRLNETLERRVAARTLDLESANRELEAFTYSVSHDLRAPLRHIMGFVEILEKETGSKLSEMHRHHLTTISGAAHRMGELIDDLLAFSRIGRSEIQKSKVNMKELVMEALKDLQEETKDRLITWKIHDLPDVKVDRSLMRQALVNLISNAVKFTSTRPNAHIEIGCEAPEEAEHIFYIRDNGVGFDPRYTKKLFGVFERLHNGSEFEGTGIGLANVERIIRRHGGRVWATGKVDAGATFHFSIPAEATR